MKLTLTFVTLALLNIVMLDAAIKSTSGNISFKPTNTEVKMTLNSTGLGIGVTSPSANLHIAGNSIISTTLSIGSSNGSSNLNINGTLAMTPETASDNITLSANSIVLADTSSGNLTLTLPDASTVSGRKYTIKKINASNNIQVLSNGGTIDGDFAQLLSSDQLGYMSLIASANNWYLTSKSNSSTIPFSPDLISGLAAWLDASDSSTITTSNGNVTAWTDKSNNSRDMTTSSAGQQGQLYSANQNGLDGIYCDGTDDYIEIGGSVFDMNTGGTVIMLVKAVSGGNSASNDSLFNINNSGDNGRFYSQPYTGAVANRMTDTVGTSTAQENTNIIDDSAHMVTSTWAYSSFITTAIDGNLTPISTATNAKGADAWQGTNKIICANRNKSQSFEAVVYEFLYWESVLSTSQIQTLEGYLAHKWGTTASLPAGHPYKSSAP